MSQNQIAFTLDSDFYTSPEIHRRELEAIFYRSWQYACHKSQIYNAGDFFSFTVGAQHIFLVRGKDDLVRGFFNVCPHRAHPLVSGCGNKQSLVCPYHSWTFFLNGEFCRTRKTQSLDVLDPAQFNLSEVRVEEFLGFYFVNLDEKAPPLRILTGRLETEVMESVRQIDNLVHCNTLANEIKANWKVLIDNHLDDHPLSPVFNAQRKKENALATTHSTYVSLGEHTWWLWPNVFFMSNPSRGSLSILKVKALNELGTRQEIDVFCGDGAEVEVKNLALKDLRSKLHSENIALCERVQVGLGSRAYQRGPLVINPSTVGKSEHALFHFHSLVQDALSRLKLSSKTVRPGTRDINAPV